MTVRSADVPTLAREFLEKCYNDLPSSTSLEVREPVEHPNAWAVAFKLAKDTEPAPTNPPVQGVVIVPKDGSTVHFSPSALPVAVYLEQMGNGRPLRPLPEA
ncbi:hypothetical protein ABZ746_26150 [Streptomyces sp. NPDC020096]